MPDIRPAQFPHEPCSQIRLCNLVVTRRLVLPLEIAGESSALWMGPTADLPGTPIALTAGSGNVWLTLTPALFQQWLQPWIGHEPLTRLPPALREAAREAALAPLLTALKATTGLAFALTESSTPPPETCAQIGLWRTDSPAGTPDGVLHLDDAVAAALTARLERLPAAAPSSEPWPALPIEVTLWLGQTRLTVQECRGLEISDILLLPPAAPDAALELILRHAGRPLAATHLHRRQLLIDRLVPTAMSERSPVPAAPQPPLDPDQLEIRLDFDLGYLTVPLRELRTIQPGYSFELDRPDPQAVRIVAGAQVIGYGELVQIDDRLGVRVTALHQAPE